MNTQETYPLQTDASQRSVGDKISPGDNQYLMTASDESEFSASKAKKDDTSAYKSKFQKKEAEILIEDGEVIVPR